MAALRSFKNQKERRERTRGRGRKGNSEENKRARKKMDELCEV